MWYYDTTRKTLLYMTHVPKEFNSVYVTWLDCKLILKVPFLFPLGDVKRIVKKGEDSLFFKDNGFYHIVNTKHG